MNKPDDTQPHFIHRCSFKIIQYLKRHRQMLYPVRQNRPKTIVFILGCQRSGTSILTRIFARDLTLMIFGEYSPLSSDDPEGLRLNSVDKVNKLMDKVGFEFIVAKPLVESQNALNLLKSFPGSKIIWMFRHYKDVSSSNIKKFSEANCIRNLNSMIARDYNNWRAEKLPEEMFDLVQRHYTQNITAADAAALFWIVRNNIFFHNNLGNNKNVIVCNYDKLISIASDEMKRIYDFLGKPYPKNNIVSEVHVKSKGKGVDLKTSPEIESICEKLWQDLLLVNEENK